MTTTPQQSAKQAFAQYVVESMAGLGDVQARPMFGGFGVYLQGLMFALLLDDVVYIKVDEVSVGRFQARGLVPFQYEARGKVSSLKYYQAPDEAYDDRDAMVEWARLGFEAALRQRNKAASRKTRQRPRSQTAFTLSVVDASKAVTSADLQDLPNLGPKSRDMLVKAGIDTADELRRVGAVVAYVRTKAVWPQASLNLLWALEGALSGRPWQQVAETDRASLLMALEDVERQWPRNRS